MRNLMFAVVLVVIGIAVVGYNRGWFPLCDERHGPKARCHGHGG